MPADVAVDFVSSRGPCTAGGGLGSMDLDFDCGFAFDAG